MLQPGLNTGGRGQTITGGGGGGGAGGMPPTRGYAISPGISDSPTRTRVQEETRNEVARECDYLANKQGQLSDLLQLLHSRLTTVMHSDSPEKPGDEPRPSTDTSLGQFLADQSSKTSRDIQLLQNMLSRLEI